MYIDEARRLDLQPSITAELLTKIDANTGTYTELINGGTYVVDEVTYTFAGLKKTLAYFVFARLIKNNAINVTAFGVVVKEDPNSMQATEKRISLMASEAYGVAVAYLDDCLNYIKLNFEDETVSTQPNVKKFRISEIGD